MNSNGGVYITMKKTILIAFVMWLVSSTSLLDLKAADADKKSYSTSNLLPLKFESTGGVVDTRLGDAVVQGDSYVTIVVEKMVVSKRSSWASRIFTSGRTAVAYARISGAINGDAFDAIQIGNKIKYSGSGDAVDLGASFVLFDRVPWVMDKLTIRTSIEASGSSVIDGIFTNLVGAASLVPNFKLSTAVLLAGQVSKVIDGALFGGDRSFNILDANIGVAVSDSNLREGRYVLFAADKQEDYAVYLGQPPDGKEGLLLSKDLLLKFAGENIKNVSYIVFRIEVSNRRFDDLKKHAFNSITPWGKKFFEVNQGLSKIARIPTAKRTEFVESLKRSADEASVLLGLDLDVLNSEKILIEEEVTRLFTQTANEQINLVESVYKEKSLPKPTSGDPVVSLFGLPNMLELSYSGNKRADIESIVEASKLLKSRKRTHF